MATTIKARITVGGVHLLHVEGNPNGSITAPTGSLAMDSSGSNLYQNTDGSTTWFQRGNNNISYSGWEQRSSGTNGDFAYLDDTGALYNYSSTAGDWIRSEAYVAFTSGSRTMALVTYVSGTESYAQLETQGWTVTTASAGSILSGGAPSVTTLQATGTDADMAYISRVPSTATALYFQGHLNLVSFEGVRDTSDFELRSTAGSRLAVDLKLTGSTSDYVALDNVSGSELTGSAKLSTVIPTGEVWVEAMLDPDRGAFVWIDHSAQPILAIATGSLNTYPGASIRLGDDSTSYRTALAIRSGTFVEV